MDMLIKNKYRSFMYNKSINVYDVYCRTFLDYFVNLIRNNPLIDIVSSFPYNDNEIDFLDKLGNKYTIQVDETPHFTFYNIPNGIEISFALNVNVGIFNDEINSDIDHFQYTDITGHAYKAVYEALDKQEWNKILTRILNLFLEKASYLPINIKEFSNTMKQFPVNSLQIKIEDKSSPESYIPVSHQYHKAFITFSNT